MTIEAPKPGIYDVSFAEYQQWDAANSTALKWMRHAPAFAKYMIEHQATDEDEEPHWAVFGRLFHLLCTEHKKADKEFIIIPDTYPKEVSEGRGKDKTTETAQVPWNMNANHCMGWWAQQKANGLQPIKRDGTENSPGYNQAEAMAEVVRNHPRIGKLISLGKPEVSVVWRDDLTGVLCKGRYDVWSEPAVVAADLKSTVLAREDAFWSQSFKQGYHLQVAMYIDSLIALGKVQPDRPVKFLIVAVEKYAPYLVNVFEINDDPGDDSFDWLDLGRKDYRPLLAQYGQCKETGIWPGYGYDTKGMALPAWAIKELQQTRKIEWTQ